MPSLLRRSALRFSSASTFAFAFALALPAAVHAQAATGWALNRYEPTPAGDLFFMSDYAVRGRASGVSFRAGLLGDYAYHPLVLRGTTTNPDGSTTTSSVSVIDHMIVLHAQLGMVIADRFTLHASLPVTLLEAGPSTGTTPVVAANAAGVGDPRLGMRVRVFGETDRSPIGLSFGAMGYLGFLGASNRASNNTDEGFRARVYANVNGRASLVRYSVQMGVHFRPRADVVSTTVGNEWYVNAAVGVVLARDKLTVGPEMTFATVLDRAFQTYHNHFELLAGAHYQIARQLTLGAGIGFGVTRGPGTPALRALVQIAWAPEADAPTPMPVESETASTTQGSGRLPGSAAPAASGDTQCASGAACATRDADGDGVFDLYDQCPIVAEGPRPHPNHVGCPEGDSDDDGVYDLDDRCSETPEGPHPDPARRGCPIDDRDNDTVADETDHCPDTAGMPSTDPEKNGCPGLAQIEQGMIRILTPVFFASNSDVILPRSIPVLSAVRDTLAAATMIQLVSIEGHTDDVGDDEKNIDLSQRRAAAVVRWLIEHGVAPTRLEAHGYGETRPIVDVAALTGAPRTQARSRNRRVEFRVINPPAPASTP